MTINTILLPDAPAIEPIHDNTKKRTPISWLRWFQGVKQQLPLFSVSTAAGNVTIPLPTFTNPASAAVYLNREHLYLKSTADANTVTITGAAVGGSVVLSSQGDKARFRFDGKNWWTV